MEELLKQLKALQESIGSYQDRIAKLEGSSQEMQALKAVVDKQRMELDELIAKIGRQGVAGLNRQDEAKTKAIAQFAAMARGNFKDAMRTSSNEDGGFLISPEVEAGILRLAQAEGSMRSLADVRSTNREAVVINVRIQGAAAGHVGEDEERDITEGLKYAQITIPVHTQYAQPEITQTALEDADVDLAAEIIDAIGEALGSQDEEDFVSGDGVKKPRGILSYPIKLCSKQSDLEWEKLGYVKTGKDNAFAETSPQNVFIQAKKLLHVRYRTGAVISANSNTVAEMEKMVDGEGRPLWTMSVRDGEPDRFAGLRVVVNDYLPDMDSGKPFALVGDLRKAYAIRDRKGMTLTRDAITHKGFVKFYTEKRTGAGVKNFKALVLVKAAQ